MTTKLIKKTIEEITGADGETVEKVIAIEMALLDENGNEIDGNEIGRINTNQWGGNFNFNKGNIDVEAVSEAIANILIGE